MRNQRNLAILVGFPPKLSRLGYPSFHRSCFLIIIPVIEMRFETGDEKLKSLETMSFVGAGRFVVQQGKPVVVEYKLSRVVKGK